MELTVIKAMDCSFINDTYLQYNYMYIVKISNKTEGYSFFGHEHMFKQIASYH